MDEISLVFPRTSFFYNFQRSDHAHTPIKSTIDEIGLNVGVHVERGFRTQYAQGKSCSSFFPLLR